jgi:hypothetical protein
MTRLLTPPKKPTKRSSTKRKKKVVSGTAKLTRGKKVGSKPFGEGRYYQDIPDFYYGIKRK